MQLPLGTILFLIFLVLKLTGYIAWSWVWVTAPLWIGVLFGIIVMAFVALIVRSAVASVIRRR